MYILGINGSTLRDGVFRRFGGMHNASACILRDGELLAFIEEERFTHIKQFGGFPYHSIRYCLETAGIDLSQVDHVAYGWKSPAAMVGERLRTYFKNGMFFRTNYALGVLVIDLLEVLGGGLKRSLRRNYGAPVPPISFVEHHAAHAASSFRCSGLPEATIINIDGAGETTATYLGHGRGDTIQPLEMIRVPNSLGKVYYLFTQYLGFTPNNDEYKVMGLASYGRPRFDLSGIGAAATKWIHPSSTATR
jgi:carbamoyltransferase